MSKQSNEILAAADRTCDSARSLSRRDRKRPNRDAFIEAQNHADTLGLDEKVSDGLRQALTRFENSPLTLMMEVINDSDQPWDRKMDAASRAFPYLHRKLEDKHGTPAPASGSNGTSPGGGSGPTINLTVNRPKVTVNERVQDSPAAKPKRQTTSAKHASAAKAEERPKAFKKPARKAK